MTDPGQSELLLSDRPGATKAPSAIWRVRGTGTTHPPVPLNQQRVRPQSSRNKIRSNVRRELANLMSGEEIDLRPGHHRQDQQRVVPHSHQSDGRDKSPGKRIGDPIPSPARQNAKGLPERDSRSAKGPKGLGRAPGPTSRPSERPRPWSCRP